MRYLFGLNPDKVYRPCDPFQKDEKKLNLIVTDCKPKKHPKLPNACQITCNEGYVLKSKSQPQLGCVKGTKT